MDEIINLLPDRIPVLVVDDDETVIQVTRLVLSRFRFDERALELICAASAREAIEILAQRKDIAIVLLDVVMESDDSGFEVVSYIRHTLHNYATRILLRTGQPGLAPERQVINDYDINDYKSKTELTAQKLFTVIMSSLRSYRDIISIEQSREGLEKIIIASRDIFSAHSIEHFIEGVMQQLTSLLGVADQAVYASTLVAQNPESGNNKKLIVCSGTGDFERSEGKELENVLQIEHLSACHQALNDKSIIYKDNYLFAYCSSKYNHNSILFISGIPKNLTDIQRHLIKIFSQNVQLAFENVQLQCEIRQHSKTH